jgi:Zn ribbon nucleic-acid-binding protein
MDSWICPRCGRVYGPLFSECRPCNDVVVRGQEFRARQLAQGGHVRCPCCKGQQSMEVWDGDVMVLEGCTHCQGLGYVLAEVKEHEHVGAA